MEEVVLAILAIHRFGKDPNTMIKCLQKNSRETIEEQGLLRCMTGGEIPEDTRYTRSLVNNNTDEDLRDAVSRGWITPQQANTIAGKEMIRSLPMSAVSVHGEDHYRFTNGHAPRGYGQWAFRIGNDEVFIPGTYTQAKAEARRRAARLGLYSVTVLT